MISFRTSYKNIEAFECLEDTEYLYITRLDMNKLLECSKNFRVRYCDILEINNAEQINHIHFITNLEACAKLQYFKTKFPYLIGRVSDQIIASFIGFSRETFVRKKNQIS